MNRRVSRLATPALAMMLATAPIAAEEYTVNFNDTDINELIRFVADATGETFLIDPKVRGKIQLVSSTPVDDEQLYDLFLAVLEIHGYTAVRASDGIVTVLPIQEAKTEPGPVGVSSSGRENREIVIRVISLANISANKLVSVVRPLLPAYSHLSAYPPTNSIIIADNAANIAKMLKIISKLDKDTEGQVDIINLRYAAASQISNLVQSLLKKQEAKGEPLVLVTDERTNSILIKGNELQREQVASLIARLDSPIGQISNARVKYLKHTDAAELAPTLNKVIENISNREGGQRRRQAKLEAHPPTNSLIITAEGEVLKTLEAIIEQLDVRRAQVLVEAIIVEIMDDNSEELGLEYLFADEDLGLFTFAEGLGGSLRLIGNAVSDGSGGARSGQNLALALGAVGATRDGVLAGLGEIKGSGGLFLTLLNALKKSTRANILSTPNLLTLENTEAYIVVGQNVPFVTGSYSNNNNTTNPFQTISRRDVGTTLKVTPYINEGNTVLLDIEQEVSSISGDTSNAADIITNQRKIQTTILAGNGEIVVLGGLISNTINETARKVPLLGDIPLLGYLFRNNSSEVQKVNLLVFIRPTIIRTNETIRRATESRYRRIYEDQIRYRKKRRAIYGDTQRIFPSWEEQLQRNLIDADLGDIPEQRRN